MHRQNSIAAIRKFGGLQRIIITNGKDYGQLRESTFENYKTEIAMRGFDKSKWEKSFLSNVPKHSNVDLDTYINRIAWRWIFPWIVSQCCN